MACVQISVLCVFGHLSDDFVATCKRALGLVNSAGLGGKEVGHQDGGPDIDFWNLHSWKE